MATTIVTSGTDARTSRGTAAWRRRVLGFGGLVQACFAASWLLLGSRAIEGDAGTLLAAVLGGCSAGVLAYGALTTQDKAPRPTGFEAGRLDDLITPAAIAQLLAALAAPALVANSGREDWVLPVVVMTVGPFLLWLDHLVDVPRYRPVGWGLVAGPVLLVTALDGAVLAASTALAAGLVLLVTAAAGFHEVARSDRATDYDAGAGTETGQVP
jgi:hypothetical protein